MDCIKLLKPKMKVNIITGAKQSGKTTFLLDKIQELRKDGKIVSGFISRGTFVDHKRHSFFVQDISTGKEQLLMTTDLISGAEKIGKFYIDQEAFDWGKSILEKAINSNADYIVLDEVGRFELEEKGWSSIIPALLKSDKELFFIVREEWVNGFIEKYQITDFEIIRI